MFTKKILQGYTREARTLAGIIEMFQKDILYAAKMGDTSTSWAEDLQESDVTAKQLSAALNAIFREEGSDLYAEVMDNSERIIEIARRRETRPLGRGKLPPLPKLRKRVVVSWEDGL